MFRVLAATRRPHTLLLHAPGGHLSGFERIRGLRTLQATSLLDNTAQFALDERVLTTVEGFLASPARDLFPRHHGVHLGDLNRLLFEIDFFDLGILNNAMRRVDEESSGQTHWTLFGYETHLLFAAESEARRIGRVARAWPPRSVAAIRDSQTARRAYTSVEPVQHIWRVPRADVLSVSWTRPMHEMFAAVENQLAAHGAIPAVRVHFGDALPPDQPATGVTVVAAPSPDCFGRLAPPTLPEPVGNLSGPAFEVDNGRFVRSRIDAVRRNAGRQMAFIETVSRLLDAVQPRVVAVGNDRWWVGQAVVRLAQLRGIPTLCLQDGVSSESVVWRWLAADRLLSNGVQLRDLLVRNGIPESRVIATGQPRYDTLPSFAGPEATRRARAQLQLPPDRQHVLYPTQYDQDRGYVEGIVRACLELPNVHLMLRPHPSESSAFHEALVRAHPDRIRLCREERIETLVAACDVLVAKSSTTTLEAAMLGKNVIIVHDHGQRVLPHTEALKPIFVKTAAELPDALRALANGSFALDVNAARATFEYYCGPFDGKSSARAAEQFALALEGSAQMAQRGSRDGDAFPPSAT
jgi:hypothetical protein